MLWKILPHNFGFGEYVNDWDKKSACYWWTEKTDRGSCICVCGNTHLKHPAQKAIATT